MRDIQNPFALVRASDFSDTQINELWVELGARYITAVIEPRSRMSRYILGGKGTGKTHLLRYHSYPVARLRGGEESGLKTVENLKFLGVFVRATNIDAGRFEPEPDERKWQQLFGVYFELRLVEGLLDALKDIKQSSPGQKFIEAAILRDLRRSVHDPEIASIESIGSLLEWVERRRREIDEAVDNAAFTGELNVRAPFPIGGLCVPLTKALPKWHPNFASAPVIFLIDEIENFSEKQQQVLNSLVRYGEGVLTFRITGRLYSRKTLATMANGEENREGSEFTTVELDEILRAYEKYPEFAKKFVARRLSANSGPSGALGPISFDPIASLEELSPENFYQRHIRAYGLEATVAVHARAFRDALEAADSQFSFDRATIQAIEKTLLEDFPPLIQRLNMLLYCKKFRRGPDPREVAKTIASGAEEFIGGGRRSFYANAYGHYAVDLFAQMCRESRKLGTPLYAGFETFIKMSSGNPRNLLICLSRLYEITSFREIDLSSVKLSPALQTEAALEAARFLYERDSNYGAAAESAREAVNRLAVVLRTARYALNIPEVSPLTVSFSDGDAVGASRTILRSALNYSLLFEVKVGRPDRNSQDLLRKLQLNPLLAPRWGLPTARRGDLSLSKELVNAIFDPDQQKDFEALLRLLAYRWNFPFTSRGAYLAPQPNLF
jgi:hypothetical protein